ncbi:MAG: deaminase [Spirochaetaceae bacterium]|mgnify:CR=1|nr:deaminase [Spirochaetaceae bacterium]|tara:strand:+ start:10974 stop:11525 length:552 start_codon:yes stop_codon:yes gene_type:complete
MKTQYYTASTLDGFIATEDHSLEWLFPLGDIAETGYADFFAEVGALAMGSSTFQWMMDHHLRPGSPDEQPWPYEKPVWLFSSRHLELPPGADIRLVRGDVRPVHAEMAEAAAGQNLWVVGGGDLAGQFYDAGLLDELIIQVGSTTLGKGMPLFPRITPPGRLKLVSATQMGPGFAELRYSVEY